MDNKNKNDNRSTYRDYLLDFDRFNKPKIFNDTQAIASLLTRLILLEPGTNPLFPEMGVGIVSRYRYTTEDQKYQLSEDIKNQINTYLPEALCTNVKLSYNIEKELYIEITVDNTIFIYKSNEKNPLTLEDIKI